LHTIKKHYIFVLTKQRSLLITHKNFNIMKSINSIIANYNTAKKQAAISEKQAAIQAKAAARAKAAADFQIMSGVVLITEGHDTWSAKDAEKSHFTIAVKLERGLVCSATPIEYHNSWYRNGDPAWGLKSAHMTMQFKAPYTPKTTAVYERCTRSNGEYEQHQYTYGKVNIGYQAMRSKVEQILATPQAKAAIEAAKAAAKTTEG